MYRTDRRSRRAVFFGALSEQKKNDAASAHPPKAQKSSEKADKKEQNLSVSVLALSVTFGDTSPKGRGKGFPVASWLPLWGSWTPQAA